jgi:hypothetical protein
MFKKLTPTCNHRVNTCSSCVREHLTTILNGGSLSAASSYSSIVCMNAVYRSTDSCTGKFDAASIQSFLTTAGFTRWQELAFQEWVEGQPEFRWCSSPTCGSGQLVDGGETASSYFTCMKCHNKTCMRHRVPFHNGVSCDAYDKSLATDERALAGWKAQHTKPCPNCRHAIEKNGGCDHMTCKNCSTKHTMLLRDKTMCYCTLMYSVQA